MADPVFQRVEFNGGSLYVPVKAVRFPEIPAAELAPQLSAETRYILSRLYAERYKNSQELDDLEALFEGGDAALTNDRFPCPDNFDHLEWEELKKRLMMLVNLLKAIIKRLRSAVYGNRVHRIPSINHPYRDELLRSFGRNYPQQMRGAYQNAIHFGMQAVVRLLRFSNVDRSPVLKVWLPNPKRSFAIPDPTDIWEYIGVGEYSCDWNALKFVTRDACGCICAGSDVQIVGKFDNPPASGSWIQFTGMGFLPAVIRHGDDRRHMGLAHGISIARDAIKATTSATNVLLKGQMLSKLQSAAILWCTKLAETGDWEKLRVALANGILPLPEGGQAGYATPATNIKDILGLLDKIIAIVSITSGIPIEDLNAQYDGDFSAEAATRRAVPLTSLAEEQTDIAIADEQELALISTALLQWHHTGGRIIDIETLRQNPNVETEVRMSPTVIPESSTSIATTAIMLHDAGAMDDADFALLFNKRADPAKLKRIEAAVAERTKLKLQPKPAPEPTKPQENSPDEMEPPAKTAA